MKQIAMLWLSAAALGLASCAVGPGEESYSGAYPPSYGTAAPLEPYGCADWMHQNRPGGTDYYGPPIYGC